MSSPSEPVDTTSMSMAAMFLPSRMIEPLPKLRSICDSAASRAFDLSMDEPSTRRSAAAPAALIIRAPYGRDSVSRQRTPSRSPKGRERQPQPPGPAKGDRQHCTLFVLGSQYVLWGGRAQLSPWNNYQGCDIGSSCPTRCRGLAEAWRCTQPFDFWRL